MEAGQTIRAYGHTLEILDTHFQTEDGEGILCLDKDILTNMAFSEENDNDYTKSDVKEYCDNLAKKLKEKGAELKPVSIDLTADDGTGWDKEPCKTEGVFLLTADMYRKYRRYISNKDNWWWLSTAYSFTSGNSRDARYVYTDGSLYSGDAYRGDNGVSPAYAFSLLEEDKDEMTLDRVIDILRTEKECVERAGTGTPNKACSRECAECDLVLPDYEIIKAYEMAINVLNERK